MALLLGLGGAGTTSLKPVLSADTWQRLSREEQQDMDQAFEATCGDGATTQSRAF